MLKRLPYTQQIDLEMVEVFSETCSPIEYTICKLPLIYPHDIIGAYWAVPNDKFKDVWIGDMGEGGLE